VRGCDPGRPDRPAQRARPPALAALLTVCSLLVTGCGLLGGPQPLTENAPLSMSVSIPVLSDDVLPARFTCYSHPALQQSPPVFWSGAPPGTRSLALVVDDSSTPIEPRVYWLVFDIHPGTTDLQPVPASAAGELGALPPGSKVAQNSARIAAYDPPCPRAGPHKYRFTVYALNTSFDRSLPYGAPLLQAWTTIAAHVLARGTATATVCPPVPAGAPACSAS
jgi:Raf kinase inhibitor-like YbhB/YbcL family protein